MPRGGRPAFDANDVWVTSDGYHLQDGYHGPAGLPASQDNVVIDLPAPVTVNGVVYSSATIWGAGIVSFGLPTSTQIQAFDQGKVASGGSGFPGDYIAFGQPISSNDYIFTGFSAVDGSLNVAFVADPPSFERNGVVELNPPGSPESSNINIVFNVSSIVVNGGTGSDHLLSTSSDDTLSGGGGVDSIAYSGLVRSFNVSLFSRTVGTVSGIETGTDTLSSLEYIKFHDGFLTFDPSSNAAKIMRLYDAVLGRQPDATGLDSWLDTLDAGASFGAVAQGFLVSPEFQRATGSLSNADFVEYLYGHALGRASDPDGKAGWIGALNGGASRADVLIGFSESAEHRELTADTLGHGLFITDNSYQVVAALYDTFANRLPDTTGLEYWAGALKSGTETLAQVAAGFAASPEFAGHTDGLSNAALVDFMYVNTLNRGADTTGAAYWTGALDHGLSHGDLLLGFSQSPEHLQLIESNIQYGIAFG